MTFFSASALAKKSAAQIKYLRDRPLPNATPNQLLGNKNALERSTSVYLEMQGKFVHKDIEIYFSIDEVKADKNALTYVEHKIVFETSGKDYFKDSLIQTAFYGALASYVNTLATAKYFEGPKFKILIDSYTRRPPISILNFGGKCYKVKYNRIEVMRFFLTKARASLADYDVARRFDFVYRGNEWDYFKNFIRYRKV